MQLKITVWYNIGMKGEFMADNEESKKNIPPYISYKTLIGFIDKMKVAMPSRIDRSLMGTMSGTMQAQLTNSLRFLNLITPNDLPTEKLTRLVNSEDNERQKVLREILKASYLFLFDNFDLQHATTHQLQERFIDAGASGDTVRKCMAFFMTAAKDSGIILSPHISRRRITGRLGRPRGRKTLSISDNQQFNGNETDIDRPKPGSVTWQQMLLSKFPSFDPAWPDDVKSKWFDGFKELMQLKGEFQQEKEKGE